MTTLGRFWRTTRGLRPIQLATRLPSALLRNALPPLLATPLARAASPRPAPNLDPRYRIPLATFAEAERARYLERRPYVPDRLGAYEANYGLDLGDGSHESSGPWESSTASEPFCASVRARRLAVAFYVDGGSASSRSEHLAGEIARAARAILLQIEFHLLGNHLLENALGLVAAGSALEGTEADLWFQIGAALLNREVERQFLPDGGHFERSVSYHLNLLAGLLEAMMLATARGRSASPRWYAAAERASAFAAAVRAPDGTYPLFNDASLDASPAVDQVLSLARQLDIVPAARLRSAVVHLETTGWLILEQGPAWLVLDAGPEGPREQPGHVHADALTFELWLKGQRAIVDYGVGSYGRDDERARTRATKSHNTLEIDGIDSSEVWAAFRTGRMATARVISVTETGEEIRVRASHNGYQHLVGHPEHARTLVLSRTSLRIVDHVPHGHQAISRLRLARDAVGDVRGNAPVRGEPGTWYPQFRRPEPAQVLTQNSAETAADTLEWQIEWPLDECGSRPRHSC